MDDALRREVVDLRQRVAELQRAAARHEETEGTSLAEREELLREAERVAHLGTDVAMAHMRGPELVTRLAPQGKPVRVLFITGYSEEAAAASLRHAVLAKPFTAAALAAAIGEVIGS